MTNHASKAAKNHFVTYCTEYHYEHTYKFHALWIET